MAVGWFSRQQSSRAHPPRWLSLWHFSFSLFSLLAAVLFTFFTVRVPYRPLLDAVLLSQKRQSYRYGAGAPWSTICAPHTHKFIRELFLSWRHPPAILPRSLYIYQNGPFFSAAYSFFVISFFFLRWNIISHQWLYLSLPPHSSSTQQMFYFSFLLLFDSQIDHVCIAPLDWASFCVSVLAAWLVSWEYRHVDIWRKRLFKTRGIDQLWKSAFAPCCSPFSFYQLREIKELWGLLSRASSARLRICFPPQLSLFHDEPCCTQYEMSSSMYRQQQAVHSLVNTHQPHIMSIYLYTIYKRDDVYMNSLDIIRIDAQS